MPHFSTELASLIAQRHGVVRHAELIADGFNPAVIRKLITAGALMRHHRGTYRLSTAPDTFEFRCAAASLAERSAIVTGAAAARLWEFRHVAKVELPIVLLEHDRNALTHGVLVRRTNQVNREDVVLRPDGIRLASPPRTWFDCARDLEDEPFEMLTEWVIDHHARVPTLWRLARRLDQRGRPGLARVKRVLSQRQIWQKPAGSGLELRVLAALRQAGLPELVRQYPVRLGDGSVVHPDGALPDLRWAIEVDHVTWHGGRFDAQYDKSRDRKARRAGWTIERVSDRELSTDFGGTIADIVEMYHHHLARPRPD